MKELNNEIWKDIPNYEGFYQASNLGRIKSLDREVVNRNGVKLIFPAVLLKLCSGKTSPYLCANLCKNNINKKYMVHRLVAMCFLPDWNSRLEVNHIDGNVFNNNVSNLEMCTRRENYDHAIIHNLKKDYGEQSSNAKLTNFDAMRIRNLHEWGIKQKDLAIMYHVNKQTISSIVNHKTYFR